MRRTSSLATIRARISRALRISTLEVRSSTQDILDILGPRIVVGAVLQVAVRIKFIAPTANASHLR